jgi:hypothetical protein
VLPVEARWLGERCAITVGVLGRIDEMADDWVALQNLSLVD